MSRSKHGFLNFLYERKEELSYLLWAAMIMKAAGTLLNQIGGGLNKIVSWLNAVEGWQLNLDIVGTTGSVLDFLSGVVLLAFFVAEMFLLPPWGLLLMLALVGLVMFLIPYAVITVTSLLAGSLLLFIIALPLCYLLSGVILTFVGGVLSSIEVVTVTAPLTIAMGAGAGAAAAGSAVAYGTMAALDGAELIAYKGRKRRAVLGILANLVILTAVGWPLLSATESITGIMAFKLAVIASQSFLNGLNVTGSHDYKAYFDEKKEKNWVFESNFYSTYINNGSNDITQGKTNLFAGNEQAMAVLLNGTLRVYDAALTKQYGKVSYQPRETDAMVLVGTEAFVFGRNKVLVSGSKGRYTWKKTKWTSEFEKLSEEEQFERVYDILERQNTQEKRKFFYDEVGMVAYAQRNGLLLGYDAEGHTALFASRGENGDVTVYRQGEAGQREKVLTFTPAYASNGGLPYYADMNENAIRYLAGKEIKAVDLNDGTEYTVFTYPEQDDEGAEFTALHYGDPGDENRRFCVYIDNREIAWLDRRPAGSERVESGAWDTGATKISGFAGERFYSFQYNDSSLLAKLTYLEDYKSMRNNGYPWTLLTDIRSEDWHYQSISPFAF